MRFAAVFAGICSIGFVQPAIADNPASAASLQRISGKIDAYDPASRMLTVATGDKKTVSVALEPDLRVIYDAKRTLNDVKTGDFVGSETLRSADGSLRAQEVHIFPDSMRGAGEGQYTAGDLNSSRTMTNATVVQVNALAANKGSIELSYHGATSAADGGCTGRAGSGTGCTGEAKIKIVPGVPIIALVVGDKTLLVPGAVVSLSAVSKPDGTLTASRLSVEKDGVRPIL